MGTTSLVERIWPLGDCALVIELGDSISPSVHAKVKSVLAWVRKTPGVIECVPAFTSVTVYYDPWVMSEEGSVDPVGKLKEVVAQSPELEFQSSTPSIVEIPVLYDGPDLEAVAKHTGLDVEEVISIHSSPLYLTYMIGFVPGFPYLGGMDERLTVPRRSSPRLSIPAGSVGIAGKQTGVYPVSTPGGWQIIGRTSLTLFDPGRDQPSMIAAGDQVRFVPVRAL